MVNGALGRSLEYPTYSLGRILKAPLGFSKCGQTKGQKPLVPAAPWVLAFGLALDVASGSPLENPLGDLQSSPQGVH